MSTNDPQRSSDPLQRSFRLAYVLGLFICVAWPLALQLMLGTVIRRGSAAPDGLIRDLGYTFTGLTFLAAAFVTWRWGKVREAFPKQDEAKQAKVIFRETILYSALFELCALYGVLYYALGGPLADRYGRSFIALATIMFFVFVPRFQAWKEAADRQS